MKGRYDAYVTSDENKNIWAEADQYDSDSANNKVVRHRLMWRSRYEIGNNGYSSGIASTAATDLVGCGPALRMQTQSEGFNRMVETQWYLWCKSIKFRRKLWCMAHAKHSDGESFAVMRRNPGVDHPVKIDIVLHEAEQVQTPYLPFIEPGYIDGIRFDKFGNPIYYDILRQHPGTTRGVGLNWVPEQVPAQFVFQWFRMTRPGQHRAVPEMTSTLNVGACSRRWREATLAAAETAADFTLFLKTQAMPSELDAVDPLDVLDIQKRMMTALPAGYEPAQMKAEHPTATFAEFHKTLINEQARPKSMPFNKAACDSSSYNYASGRLDHQTYYAALDVEREDCNDLVLDPLFLQWFDLAVPRFKWLGGDPSIITAYAKAHIWDWPKHRVADVEAEANANTTNLKNGTLTLSQAYSNAGQDFEEELVKMATDFGKTPEEVRSRLFDVLLPLPRGVYVPILPPVEGPDTAAPPPVAQQKPEPAKPATNGNRVTALLNGALNGH